MTRPKKKTVDWFPHSATHGRTMFVMEKRWGNNGYAFWFKLLELLANTEGHAINSADKSFMDYLQAYTCTDQISSKEMLDQLADLEAIDSNLWKEGIIWSDNFVAGILAAYKRREGDIPVKPGLCQQKPSEKGFPSTETLQKPGEEKEGEEKEGEENNIGFPSTETAGKPKTQATPGLPDFYTCKYFSMDYDWRRKLAEEFPMVSDDKLLEELSKHEDWVTDNMGKRKFKANGQMANPRLSVRNWLNKVVVDMKKDKPGSVVREPKSFAAIRKMAREG